MIKRRINKLIVLLTLFSVSACVNNTDINLKGIINVKHWDDVTFKVITENCNTEKFDYNKMENAPQKLVDGDKTIETIEEHIKHKLKCRKFFVQDLADTNIFCSLDKLIVFEAYHLNEVSFSFWINEAVKIIYKYHISDEHAMLKSIQKVEESLQKTIPIEKGDCVNSINTVLEGIWIKTTIKLNTKDPEYEIAEVTIY